LFAAVSCSQQQCTGTEVAQQAAAAAAAAVAAADMSPTIGDVYVLFWGQHVACWHKNAAAAAMSSRTATPNVPSAPELQVDALFCQPAQQSCHLMCEACQVPYTCCMEVIRQGPRDAEQHAPCCAWCEAYKSHVSLSKPKT
jgi:hypothetical protein